MDLLLKGITIINHQSSFHNQCVDLHIKDGYIHKIGPGITIDGVQVLEQSGLYCSLGWFDMAAHMGDPGFEHKESQESFRRAAAFGGFTEVAVFPNLSPITQTRSAIVSIKNSGEGPGLTIHPIGAVTENCEGKDLAELLDMHRAGAVAFSDGVQTIQPANTILKALEYLNLVGGLLINRPENHSMALGGQMHEGPASTRLGMKGIPSVAEEMQVVRDLQLLEHVSGRMHFSQISTAKSVEAIRKAKRKGLNISCDVASFQCAYIDESIEPFDTNYKVAPPFRSEQDRLAILEGLADGTIDVLVSAHLPLEVEAKELEFDFALPGIINSQTAFSVANQTMREALSVEKLVHKFTVAPREVLKLPVPQMAEGCMANLTLFHPDKNWEFNERNNASLSNNSPFLGQILKGSVFGTIHQNVLTLNPTY